MPYDFDVSIGGAEEKLRRVSYDVQILPTGEKCKKCSVGEAQRIQVDIHSVSGLELTDKKGKMYAEFVQGQRLHNKIVCLNKECPLNTIRFPSE